METVRTYVRYLEITGSDPFDDVRRLEFQLQLMQAGGQPTELTDLVLMMYPALHYAKSTAPVTDYQPVEDSSFTEAIEYIEHCFQSNNEPDEQTKEKSPNASFDIDVDNRLSVDLAEYTATQKNENLTGLLNNAIQAGFSLADIYPLEYLTAFHIIEYRIKFLNEQRKKEG